MGLLKTIGKTISGGVKNVAGAFGSGLVGAAQDTFYREYFESGSMAGNIIMKRGERIADGKRNSNAGANENVINSGALVDVQINQCMIIVENGAIVEFCTEPGRYVFDQSTAPSCLCGTNRGWEPLINEVKNRFINGGGRTSTQRIYYINLGKIWEPILWGTGNISFRNCFFPAENMPPIITPIILRGHGTCEIKVDNPLVFFCEIGAQLSGGHNSGIITLEDAGILTSTKTAINGAIGRAISQLSNQEKIDYTAVGMHLDKVEERINEHLSDSLGKKGFKIFDLHIDGTLAPNEKDIEKLNKNYEQFSEAAYFSANQNAANYNIQKTMARGFENAGNNGGAQGIFAMGMGMQSMGGANFGNMQFQQQPTSNPAPTPVVATSVSQQETWKCACGTNNVGRFCVDCGSTKPDANNTQKPADTSWTCTCGAINTTRFCASCGTKKPTVKKYKCDKCGWTPADGKPVRFCPDCGDIFNDADIIEE